MYSWPRQQCLIYSMQKRPLVKTAYSRKMTTLRKVEKIASFEKFYFAFFNHTGIDYYDKVSLQHSL